MGRNLVICCDGTGNDSSGVPSNVLRLYSAIEQRGPRQFACYHPGIGTLPLPEGRTRVGRAIRHARELCFGAGVITTVAHLYGWLMAHYEPGDSVYLFGFSRGAFTVRALAGLLHVCGLLRKDDTHLVPFAVGLYQTSEARIARARAAQRLPPTFQASESTDHARFDDEAAAFKALAGQDVRVAFLGIWDTVKAYGWLDPQSFPALRHNPSVGAVRHAVAVHERRALFKVTTWADGHTGAKEVWFAGDHSDVGGGHRGGNSALSNATLRWMLGEAAGEGLCLDPERRVATEAAMDGAAAPRTAHRDLYDADYYWLLDRLPRRELMNAVYPPDRPWRILRADGARVPAAGHAPGARLRFHWSLVARAAVDPTMSLAGLAGGLPYDEEGDSPIVW